MKMKIKLINKLEKKKKIQCGVLVDTRRLIGF